MIVHQKYQAGMLKLIARAVKTQTEVSAIFFLPRRSCTPTWDKIILENQNFSEDNCSEITLKDRKITEIRCKALFCFFSSPLK